MNPIIIQQTILAIQQATTKALKNKHTAKQFLINAGIIKPN